MPSSSYFERNGEVIVPTELCGGPWDPSIASGGPVAGLIAHEARRAVDDEGLLLARLTVDLMRPVPIAPLQVETHTVVDRRRLKLVDCTISADGTPLVRGSAQFLAPTDVDHGLAVPDLPRLPTPEECPVYETPSTDGPYLATVHRRDVRALGPPESGRLVGRWLRFSVALFPDAPLTPELAAAMAADGAFAASMVTTTGLGFINSDFTVYSGREPTGQWIANDARLRMLGRGTALGSALLHDLDGPFAQVTAVGVAQEQATGGG